MTEEAAVAFGYPDPAFESYELHCKLVRYRDHTGASMASPCIFLTQSDCPLNQTHLTTGD